VAEAAPERGIYEWWARHPCLYDAMTRIAFMGRRDQLRRRAVASLRLTPGSQVLDLGCGAGSSLELLAAAVGPQGSVLGIDASPGMLGRAAALARSRGWSNVELRKADASNLDLEPDSFDGALCALSLSAIAGHRAAIESVRGALRAGRSLAVVDATPFPGRLRILNRPLRAVFVSSTGWDAEADLVGELSETLGPVRVQRFNLGSAYVAIATRRDCA